MASSLFSHELSKKDFIDLSCDDCRIQGRGLIAVSAYCETCDTFLCAPCETEHNRLESQNAPSVLRGPSIPKSLAGRHVHYPVCPQHRSSVYFMSWFCQDHSHLVCPKCVRKPKHKACRTAPVQPFSQTLDMDYELTQFKKDIMTLKDAVIVTKGTLDSTFGCLQQQREKAKQMYIDLVAELDRLHNEMQRELTRIIEEQSEILLKQMKNIDNIIAEFDSAYRSIEKSEKKYECHREKLFVEVQRLACDINKCSEELQNLHKSFQVYIPEFRENIHLLELIRNERSLGFVKKKPEKFGPFLYIHHFVFPVCVQDFMVRRIFRRNTTDLENQV